MLLAVILGVLAVPTNINATLGMVTALDGVGLSLFTAHMVNSKSQRRERSPASLTRSLSHSAHDHCKIEYHALLENAIGASNVCRGLPAMETHFAGSWRPQRVQIS